MSSISRKKMEIVQERCYKIAASFSLKMVNKEDKIFIEFDK